MAKNPNPPEELEDPADANLPPATAESAPMLARIGDTVLVRNGFNTVPALVVNDFGGTNAPGVVGLIVFRIDIHSPNGVVVEYIPSAQHETDQISDDVLLSETHLWWRGREESERVIKPKEEVAA